MSRAKLLVASLGLVCGLFTCSEARAQFGFNPFGFGYGGNYGGGTAEGNALQGMSTVIRSAGEYNYYTSMAGVNNEETRSKYLDNKKKWQENYFQMREQRSALDAQQRERDRQSRSNLYAVTKSEPPRPMTPVGVDAVTGHITWPEILLASEFEKPRRQLDQLFELRAKTSQPGGTALKIHAATEDLARVLRGRIEKIPANEYMPARKFIEELDRTAREKSA